MVLSILSLATRPCLTRRRLPRPAGADCTVLSCSMTVLQVLLGDRGLDLGVVAANELDAREVAQVPGAQREAQVEELFLRLAGALLQLRQGHLAQGAQVGALHQIATSASCSVCVTILVELGSFCSARGSA